MLANLNVKDLPGSFENQSSGSSPDRTSKQSKQSRASSNNKKNVAKKSGVSNLAEEQNGPEKTQKKIQLKKMEKDSDDDEI